jgi:sugar O-acyltransferase (sialic acid O-acetyltransferase NeuD family)
MKRFLVIGAAGHAQEVAWSLAEETARRGERCELLFLDDNVGKGPLPSGLGEVVGTIDDAGAYADGETQLVLGIGLPRTKAAVVSRLAPLGRSWATVVHPAATIGPNVALGEGSYVAAGALVTVNVRIGRFATVNMHCQVAHDGELGDFVTLHPDVHLAGGVVVGEGAELGTGAVVIPGTTIGPWAVLGAGTVAVRSLGGRRTYVGMPARELASGER